VAKAWCGEIRSLGRPFYRRLGRGRGVRKRTPAMLATAAKMAHSYDGMSQAGG
jgi:hypothetical protein